MVRHGGGVLKHAAVFEIGSDVAERVIADTRRDAGSCGDAFAASGLLV
jgi:hypothetical protein